MTKNFLYFFTLTLLISCGQISDKELTQANPKLDSLVVVNDPKNNFNIQSNSFFEIDTSGVIMFPLSKDDSERKVIKYSYEDMSNKNYWNIIFYNSKTNEYHFLSERKMLIEKYDYYKGGSEGENYNISKTLKNIFYTIRTDDFDGDKNITTKDPQYLFISDKFGMNLKQISPANYNLNTWKYIKSSDKVVMTVEKDSDNNKKFENTDEIKTFEIELGKGTEPKEVFSEDFKNSLKILFSRDWRQIKNDDE